MEALNKVGFVFAMVVVSLLLQVEFEQNDHREDAPHFSIAKSQTIKVKATAFKHSFQFQQIRRQVYD